MNITQKLFFFVFCISGLVLLSSSKPQQSLVDERYDNILHNVGQLLVQEHYSPQNVNDQFSEKIVAAYLKQLDPEKIIFLQSDIKAFNKFDHSIDEEIKGAPVAFFYEVNGKYKERLNQIKGSCANLLANPFQFQEQDSIVTNYDKMNYPANAQMQLKQWGRKMKFFTLEKLVDLQEDQDRIKSDTIVKATDAELEIKARAFAKTTMEKSLDRLLNKTTDDDRFSMFVSTITNLMDPHTDFFMPVEKRAWDEKLSGKFYGIGALIGEENGYVKIASVSQGGPAWKTTEVNDGDLILKIAEGDNPPVDVAGYDIPDAIKLIRGSKGSTVKMTLKKADGTVKTVAIVREELKLEETFAKSSILQEGDQKTGYIYLPKFYMPIGDGEGRSCAADVAAELVKLQKEKVDGIILDLRDNGGGSLYEAVKMVGLFIPDGPVVQIKNSDGRTNFLSDQDNGAITYSGPLVVMVNEFSASASEIFAAAIQDYKRGIIIGSTATYGKGTVQRPIPLSSNFDPVNLGTVHLTMQKYYRINGASTQLKGVEADIQLPGYYEQYKLKEKDNPSALVWDEIRQLYFKPWNKQPDLNLLRQRFQKRDSSGVMGKIKFNTSWLAQQNEMSDQLNINKYKEKMLAQRAKATQTREMMQLSKPMTILKPGEANTPAEATADANNRWLNYLKKDRYLYEANLVLNDMLQGNGMTGALKNGSEGKN
jgi:carboxyl-terminal processing protease